MSVLAVRPESVLEGLPVLQICVAAQESERDDQLLLMERMLGAQNRVVLDCWRPVGVAELIFDLNPEWIREQVEVGLLGVPAKAHHRAHECWTNYVLAVESHWHRYSDRMVMNRRVSSMRESSLDGCGTSAWARIK